MCGIVGYTGQMQAAPVLLEGLKKLEYRGYDSAGIAVMQQKKIAISKVTGRIAGLAQKTDDGKLLPGTTGIGHTRWATHGAPTDTNAHPHASNDGRFAVVHNGIIENYLEVRQELENHPVKNIASQYFAVLTDTRSVGVMGDMRTYGHTVALRCVTTDDFMTVDWTKLPFDLLERVSSRITGEVPGINRVVYDITSKPPATVEWE